MKQFPKVYIIILNYNVWADMTGIGKLFDMDYASVSVSAKGFRKKWAGIKDGGNCR